MYIFLWGNNAILLNTNYKRHTISVDLLYALCRLVFHNTYLPVCANCIRDVNKLYKYINMYLCIRYKDIAFLNYVKEKRWCQ